MNRFPILMLWWQDRSLRERRLLAVLGAVAVIALLLVAVVRPLQAARGQALADLRTYQSLATRLRGAGEAGPARTIRSGDAATILAASAAAQGFSLGIAADGTATVADAPYDAVLRWIADVEATSPLRLASAAITPAAAPGRVMATLRFRR